MFSNIRLRGIPSSRPTQLARHPERRKGMRGRVKDPEATKWPKKDAGTRRRSARLPRDPSLRAKPSHIPALDDVFQRVRQEKKIVLFIFQNIHWIDPGIFYSVIGGSNYHNR